MPDKPSLPESMDAAIADLDRAIKMYIKCDERRSPDKSPFDDPLTVGAMFAVWLGVAQVGMTGVKDFVAAAHEWAVAEREATARQEVTIQAQREADARYEKVSARWQWVVVAMTVVIGLAAIAQVAIAIGAGKPGVTIQRGAVQVAAPPAPPATPPAQVIFQPGPFYITAQPAPAKRTP